MDYTTLPAVLMAQQAPVGPARPKTLAITAGRALIYSTLDLCFLSLTRHRSWLRWLIQRDSLDTSPLTTKWLFSKWHIEYKQPCSRLSGH